MDQLAKVNRRIAKVNRRIAFNTRGLEALEPPATGRANYTEAGPKRIPGLVLRVSATGSKSWGLWYRVNGQQRVMTLGKFPTIGIAVAKENAKKVLRRVQTGEDPALEKQEARKAPTVRQLADEYLEWAVDKKRAASVRNDRAMLNTIILPKMGSRKVADITRKDVEALHRLKKKTPYRANRMISMLSKMFNLAEQWGHRPQHSNPCRGIERYHEERRDRWLGADELRRLTAALDAHPNKAAGNVVRLILLTGARKNEVLSATWSEVEFERGTWRKPSHHTKQKRTETIPLSAPALALLSEMKGVAKGDYLFPGAKPKRPLTDIKRFWQSVCAMAKIENVRIHDLRHTFASHLVSGGLSLEIVGRLLGHTNPNTTGRYAHLADEPLRAATERFGAIVTGEGGAEIVELDRTQRR